MSLSRFNEIARRFGYEVSRIQPLIDKDGAELFDYRGDDGSLDYQAYRKTQVAGNRKKLNKVWVREENVQFLSRYIQQTFGLPRFGICHGTRRGNEQKWFAQSLGCEVLGTEISDTATQFPDTIQWDFHSVKPEWVGVVDFVYSNSFDHSYDPEQCLNAWMSCLRDGQVCILEHTSAHESASRLDPFGALLSQMPYLILKWGAGQYFVREILQAPAKSPNLNHAHFIVVEKRRSDPIPCGVRGLD